MARGGDEWPSLWDVMFGRVHDIDPAEMARVANPASWVATDRRIDHMLHPRGRGAAYFVGEGAATPPPSPARAAGHAPVPRSAAPPARSHAAPATHGGGGGCEKIAGFNQMFLMPDGAVAAPIVNPPHPIIEWHSNGRWFYGMVDTGATTTTVTNDMAVEMGFNLRTARQTGTATTANGVVKTYGFKVPDISIGPIRIRNVEVQVLGGSGLTGKALVGQSFLSRLSKHMTLPAEKIFLMYP